MLKKNYSAGFSAELYYICERPLIFIKNPEIIYLIEKLPADNLTNIIPELPYILIPDNEGPNGIKGDIGNNEN